MENKQFTAKPVIKHGAISVDVVYRMSDEMVVDVEKVLQYLSRRDNKEYKVEDLTEGDVRDYIKDLFEQPRGDGSEVKLISMSVEIED